LSRILITVALIIVLCSFLIYFYFPSIVTHKKSKLVEPSDPYKFIVAGHAYGSHRGKNIGLYPKLLDHLRNNPIEGLEFIVFTGDIVRKSSPNSWEQALKELDDLGLPFFFSMGNHDKSKFAINLFNEKFGDTYYSFRFKNEVFIILNTQEKLGNIPKDQLEFVNKTFDQNPSANTFFIFFHELIWTAQETRYYSVKPNTLKYEFKSNFWSELFPILDKHNDKNIFIIGGDVGSIIPAVYDKIDHITLLASGMGGIRDENYLVVSVNNSDIKLNLIPLNKNNKLKKIETYTPEYFGHNK